jgi:hypothetical protein
LVARQCRLLAAFLIVNVLVGSRHVAAQDSERPFLLRAITATLLDPTTYPPAILGYDATMRDWKTSQPLLQRGFVESNARFTLSGRPFDTPVSYSAGKKQILNDAFGVLAVSAANNFGSRVLEKAIVERYPRHHRLVATLGWVERIAFASLMSYKLAAPHYRQSRENQRLMRELGAR